MMTGLAYKSRRDAKTLKVLTILALIYLPASFVSVYPTTLVPIEAAD
jgi:hypothetical protein